MLAMLRGNDHLVDRSMALKHPVPNPHKTIFRADFPVQLEYLSLYTCLAAKVTGYSEWEVEGARVALRDPEKRRTAQLDAGSIIYDQDTGDGNCEASSLDEILKVWPSGLKVAQFKRLGLRKKYLLPVSEGSFEQMALLLNSKFFRLEELAAFVPRVEDSFVRLDCRQDDYGFHISVGPVRRREILGALDFNRNHLQKPPQDDLEKIVKEYPELAIFLDVDIFKSGVMVEATMNFLLDARKRLVGMGEGLATFLFKNE